MCREINVLCDVLISKLYKNMSTKHKLELIGRG